MKKIKISFDKELAENEEAADKHSEDSLVPPEQYVSVRKNYIE